MYVVPLGFAQKNAPKPSGTFALPLETLEDKIRGGWAGQTIGCTFGGPTEFRFKGTFIPDYQPILWSADAIPASFKNNPGLYDDVYMDLTFVDVFAKEGLDAPAASFAKAFANAPYPLWHANQMARYNILRGLPPPLSGDWRNNPHADDIDFQIEADFAGLMSPGLVNAAAAICDKIGHIMNYGDGWYGGVYIAAMYALAFVSKDIEFVVEEALKSIPAKTSFARTMQDVIRRHKEEPGDWKAAWFKVQRTWAEDVGCPEGVFSSFDIDAKINCAWVLIGLLYGGADFGKTLDIAARCGDDSDCNPASAGGILGTMLGYEKIPAMWKNGLAAIENKPFPYASISLNDAGRLSLNQALENIRRNDGRVDADAVEIVARKIVPVRTEVGFAAHYPVERRSFNLDLKDEMTFRFTGIGFAVNGEVVSAADKKNVVRAEIFIDGKSAGIIDLPSDYRVRNPTPFWAYGLRPGPHEILLRILNPAAQAKLALQDVIIYAGKK
jgi:ADP-ribosylglycohydrolase